MEAVTSALAAIDACICVALYYRQVRSARDDIERLHMRLLDLKNVLHYIEQLAKGSHKIQLPTTIHFLSLLKSCIQEIEYLSLRLGANKYDKASRRRWIPALKWPFISKEVEGWIVNIEQHKKVICDALNIDSM